MLWLPKRVAYRHLQVVVYQFFVVEFYFLFGGMDVDINPHGVNVEKQDIEWKGIGGQKVFICVHHGMMQVTAFDESLVYKKQLLATLVFLK
jgi:hypothetical protein